MVLNCVKLVVKPQLKKYFFIIYNMPGNTFYETLFNGVIFGVAYFAVDGLLKLVDDQNELNEEAISLLERCQEEISQGKLAAKEALRQIKLNKKLVSQLKDCEKKLSQCKEAVN